MKRADLFGPCPLLDSYLKTKDLPTPEFLEDIMNMMPRRGELITEFKKYAMKQENQLRQAIQNYIDDIHQFWKLTKSIYLSQKESLPFAHR